MFVVHALLFHVECGIETESVTHTACGRIVSVITCDVDATRHNDHTHFHSTEREKESGKKGEIRTENIAFHFGGGADSVGRV